ncbi:major facilitator superfamily MFS_1 [Caldicellulosiruptor hydrothermalis 108]|uniref:Major facilitator superfamily MFS_1 n=1 Tax=Caldicellulosiruptor hydrothermalis (strain DSM 18901 / VKM B-2411 / 108) TaxID=632292 RepID=E4Q8I2_CALH1|nr:MFS transporter [Caldicellulosiruptor hydrothermalis]ADQ06827.1 major facilitator superfamily MFS_1 [Caldicellulosiruptor hydrothermalis 108]
MSKHFAKQSLSAVFSSIILFIFANAFMGIGGGINDTIFNNYIAANYNISPMARGILEFPRETPGFLIIFLIGFLYFLGDLRVSIIATSLCSFALIGLGFFAPTFLLLIVWTAIYNTGTHLNMVLSSSIGMELSKEEEYGKTLGLIGSVATAASIIGYFIVMVGFKFLNFSFKTAYVIAALMYLFAALFLLPVKLPRKPEHKGFKFVIKKDYWLYYVLSIFFGARKQIFITFAPWVLIKIFKQPVANFALVGIICSFLGIGFRNIIGRLIDRLGEKKILTFDAVVIFLICLGYAATENIKIKWLALAIAYGCYIIDNLMFATSMARSTYIKKIIKHPDDLTPTLSTGTSMDHAVSMSLPMLSGFLWNKFGYEYVFLLAAFFALGNLYFVRKIKVES